MRVKRAPWLVIGLWLATVLVALPFAMMLQALIGDHLGASLAGAIRGRQRQLRLVERVSGADLGRRRELRARHSRLRGGDEEPQHGRRRARALPTVIAIAVSAHMVVSLFLIGGVMDRLARDRAIGAGAFFSACGVYAVRFFRLAIIATAVYWVLFVPYHEMVVRRDSIRR